MPSASDGYNCFPTGFYPAAERSAERPGRVIILLQSSSYKTVSFVGRLRDFYIVCFNLGRTSGFLGRLVIRYIIEVPFGVCGLPMDTASHTLFQAYTHYTQMFGTDQLMYMCVF